jgi:hypothetical protein
MSAFFLAVIALDVSIVVASTMQAQPFAAIVCDNASDLCNQPATLIVAAVILLAVFIIQR